MNINARQLVAECSAIASQPGELCEYLGKTRHKSKALKMVCAANGVEYPELLDRKWGTTAVTGRMLAVDWWKRQLKTANARLRESEQINNLHSRVQQLKKSKNRKEKLKIGYRYVSGNAASSPGSSSDVSVLTVANDYAVKLSTFDYRALDQNREAIVGMSTFFAAVVRSPLTGIVLCVEMTATTAVLVPMLVAAGTAMVVCTMLGSTPIYDVLRERLMRAEAAGDAV